MAVEKMQLVNLIGPIQDFDRIVAQYVIGRQIHMESIFQVVSNARGLHPFTEGNPYDTLRKNMEEAAQAAGVTPENVADGPAHMGAQEIEEYAKTIHRALEGLQAQRETLKQEMEENSQIIRQLEPIRDFGVNLADLFQFQFIKVRFGKMPLDGYRQMEAYLSDYNTFFFKTNEDEENVYGVYFAPSQMQDKIDSIFSSLYFQRVRISDKAQGTPGQELVRIRQQNDQFARQLAGIDREIEKIAQKEREKICLAYRSALRLHQVHDVRRFAAHTKESFYVAGWMPQDALDALRRDLAKESSVTLLVEEAGMVKHLLPPTKLKNPRLFRPFEKFVEMYGLPGYGELDPTPVFAVTYSLMFGIMYGDVGHGLVLALFGLWMAKKKNFLGPILQICGVVSTLFGFLYGSVFGFEHLLPTLWYKPMENGATMTQTLIIAVAFGTVLLSAAMVLNMINGVRNKRFAKVLFDPNGVAGFVFYWAVIIGVLTALSGKTVATAWYVILFVVLPLIAIFLKEPLTKLLEKRKDWLPENKGGYAVEAFFELFELLLSYITNTISFIRVGAFALNHAGMLAVVFTLAEMAKGASSVGVIIVGNIIVLGLEGLLVAIQVLRLEFYELFSRFFGGNGRPFKQIGGIEK